MVRLGKSFACLVLCGGILLPPMQARGQMAAQTAPVQPAASSQTTARAFTPAASQKPSAHSRRKKATPVAEAPPPAPAPPPTLEQQAPVAPQVTLQNGQLTINAPNSTMAQILRAVQVRTGAAIDIPASANNERVVAQLGPGMPRDVLNSLLHGSRFNYVILGVMGDPGGVQKVILTPRQGGSSVTAVNTAQNNAAAQPVQEDDVVDEGVPVADTSENEYQNPDQPPPPPGGFRRPMMPGGQQIDPGAQYGGGEQQNGPKTPEQLMQEMQQLQQQQQMYNQQLNPANQQPPNQL